MNPASLLTWNSLRGLDQATETGTSVEVRMAWL